MGYSEKTLRESSIRNAPEKTFSGKKAHRKFFRRICFQINCKSYIGCMTRPYSLRGAPRPPPGQLLSKTSCWTSNGALLRFVSAFSTLEIYVTIADYVIVISYWRYFDSGVF